MEEILASIRRIIEDSDNNRAEAAAIPPATIPPAANTSKPAATPPQDDVHAFRRDLAAAKPATAIKPAPVAEAPAASSAPSVVPPASIAAPPKVEPVAPRIERAVQPVRADSTLTAESMQREWRERLAAPVAPAVPPAAPVATKPEPVRAPVTEVAVPPAPAESRGTILSEVAGRQVAAAFSELSDVFASGRRRSFDEVAEEMMRPMLQEWLDNNLPTLVERLVREEIERVARGAPR